MRLHSVLLALAFATLAGCARESADPSYAGSSGSTYNAAVNPAWDHEAPSYNPTSPLKLRDYGNSGDPVR